MCSAKNNAQKSENVHALEMETWESYFNNNGGKSSRKGKKRSKGTVWMNNIDE